jgi:hypothetical protein
VIHSHYPSLTPIGEIGIPRSVVGRVVVPPEVAGVKRLYYTYQ